MNDVDQYAFDQAKQLGKITSPELSNWKCEMFGLGYQFVIYPIKGNVPNRFWRWMQYICFGNKWIEMEKPQ